MQKIEKMACRKRMRRIDMPKHKKNMWNCSDMKVTVYVILVGADGMERRHNLRKKTVFKNIIKCYTWCFVELLLPGVYQQDYILYLNLVE